MKHTKVSLEYQNELYGFEPSCIMVWDIVGEDNSDKIEILKAVVRKIIDNELTESQKIAVIKRSQGKSITEIANQMGVNVATASKHYTKGIKTLKRIGKYIAPFLR